METLEAILGGFGGRLLKLEVVVLGNSHNPSILNPDFLRHNQIVPGDYRPHPDVITTPAHSQVAYEGGFSVQSSPSHVIFTEGLLGLATQSDMQAPEIARRYLKTVPHVNYIAVGINPVIIFPDTEGKGDDIILRSIINEGPWASHDGTRPLAAVTFRFPAGNKNIGMDITSANATIYQEGEIKGVLSFRGNIHFPFNVENNSANVARDILSDACAHLREYYELLKSITEGMKL